MLCATTRRTPAASAASTRLRVPVTRISELAWRFPPFRSVSWCITTSGAASATARRTPSASNTSPRTALAPRLRSQSASASRRTNPVTECPRSRSNGTTRRPMTPVAPARKIRITQLLRHGSRRPPVPPLLEFFVVHVDEHLLPRCAQHHHEEPAPLVREVVGGLVVDDVPARLPERLPGPDDPLRLALELEDHLALEHVPEDGPGMTVRRAARIPRWQIEPNGHGLRALGNERGSCASNIVSTVLLVFVAVMPTTLGADRSSNVDHLGSGFLYHFGQRLQRPGPGVRRGSGVPDDQRGGPVPAGVAPVAVGVQPVQGDAGPPSPARPTAARWPARPRAARRGAGPGRVLGGY